MRESAFPIFDAFAFPVDVTNAQNQLVYINRAFQDLYGYGQEVIGLTPHFLLPPDFDRSTLIANLQALSERQRTFAGVQANVTARGERIEVFLAGFPLGLVPGAGPLGFIYVACTPERKEEMMLEVMRVALGACCRGDSFGGFEAAARPRRGDRQRAILRLSRLGYTTKQIAAMMGISVSTVGYVRWKMVKGGGDRSSKGEDRSLIVRALSRRKRDH